MPSDESNRLTFSRLDIIFSVDTMVLSGCSLQSIGFLCCDFLTTMSLTKESGCQGSADCGLATNNPGKPRLEIRTYPVPLVCYGFLASVAAMVDEDPQPGFKATAPDLVVSE